MAFLALLTAIFFLSAGLILFWLSRIVHAGLLDDAILSLGFAAAALGLSQVIAGGLGRGLPLLALLLSVK